MKEKVAVAAVVANVFLAGSKIAVGFFSNSAAILASGLDSLVDIFSSIVSYAGIRLAGKPADQEHPYGHYKFEVLAGVIITVIVLSAGIGIIYEAYQSLINPETISLNFLAFGVMVFSALVNEIMSRLKISYGKKENSFSLLSDGIHSRIDVYSSLAILAGLVLVRFWSYADSVLAFLMGIYIVREAFSVGKEAAGSLLDISAGEETESKIKSVVGGEGIKLSSLKTQRKGSIITADLVVELPSSLNVEKAAEVSENLRKKLMEEVENLNYVSIQIKSHEVETGFYRPALGRGFGWQRRGKFTGEIKEAEGKGVGGACVCPKCGYEEEHQRGIPCSKLQCPKCGTNLRRK
ncbi:cation diffusion facilitator family transporter [Candidatus Microgenomates bacterium]|jgi:cation diffusion facilitator family transporter|nr:MAG: cation diffusion facilitator family transporter [Candidatus Microgenomates bacterium]